MPVYLPLLKDRIEYVKNSDDYPVTMTEDDIEALLRIIKEIDSTTLFDDTILEIIQNESRKYFKGYMTADEAARRIQSKVSLYLSEQS